MRTISCNTFCNSFGRALCWSNGALKFRSTLSLSRLAMVPQFRLTEPYVDESAKSVTAEGVVDFAPDHLMLDNGDLLFNRTNSRDLVGKVGIYRGCFEDRVSFASYLVRIRVSASVSPDYLAIVLNSRRVLAEARSRALLSVNQANLNPTRYGEIAVPMPDFQTQKKRLARISERRAKSMTLQNETNAAIRHLREYRSALIAAAVTGQIDVGG